ncbi:MAG: glycoside hydrolase family 1 protein [Candidatus Kaiserbacteria bacterium]|nr:glycoside hydrolase family 1 protein [Candidatus Kaiserbacteria bacterium]MCB9815870.1 glycoside hydrolase family 1 protein [Candidatus Nomurabacteria bacterium]
MTEKKFPEGFYWGAATASYQVEGGVENCDWAEAARAKRVPPCCRACDHYNRYEADFDIAKELGHTAHRFSVEWARIEPEEGRFDQEAIEHYRKVLSALKARELTPFVTIWHFTLPLWFSQSGGFERSDAPEIFARYAAFVVEQLGDLCDHFSTMNEPNVFGSNGWLRGTWPPFKRFKLTDMVSITNSGKSYEAAPDKGFGPVRTYFKVMKNLALAHNAAYRTIKNVSPKTEVSVVKHVIVFAANWNPFNKLAAAVANFYWTKLFMGRTHKYCDSIGLNYYFYTQFGDKRQWKKTDMDWNFAPEHIYDALMMLAKYKKPLFVSEGGLADHDDSDRAEYIKKQVAATWQAIQDGADVRGHLYWSLMDNYEWALGFEKQFGLIQINYKTLERTIRPSAYVYKEIIEKNAIVE